MKCLCLVFLLLLAVAVIPSSARPGNKRWRSSEDKQKNRPTNINKRKRTEAKCTTKVEYVCGNDGKKYRNFCELKKAMCTDTCLRFAAYGRCTGNDPSGCARCSSSSYYYWPYNRNAYQVCGTDGVTYNTKCELCRKKCLTGNNNLDVDYKGCCEPQTPTPSKPNDVTTPTTATTEVTTRKATTTATTGTTTVAMTTACRIECPLEVEMTVCGTDGMTYPSPCVLLAIQCSSNPSLEIAHEGKCRGDT